jgi:hypothetical protein
MLKRLLALIGCTLLSAVAPPAAGSELQFHIHGLGFSPDGGGLLVATVDGLVEYREGLWSRVSGEPLDLKGFSITADAMYASGYRQGRSPPSGPLGLVRSRDGGATWEPVLLAGDASFPIAAAGHRSRAIYFLSVESVPRIPVPGLHVAHDCGRTWQRVAARGISGRILRLAAHPGDGRIVAAGTTTGLFLSRDGGERFRRIARGGVVSAVAFDHRGRELLYAFAYSHHLIAATTDGRQRRVVELPVARSDFVDYVAVSPTDARVLAIATRWRDVFLSVNGGATWDRIAAHGREPREEGEEEEGR